MVAHKQKNQNKSRYKKKKSKQIMREECKRHHKISRRNTKIGINRNNEDKRTLAYITIQA